MIDADSVYYPLLSSEFCSSERTHWGSPLRRKKSSPKRSLLCRFLDSRREKSAFQKHHCWLARRKEECMFDQDAYEQNKKKLFARTMKDKALRQEILSNPKAVIERE